MHRINYKYHINYLLLKTTISHISISMQIQYLFIRFLHYQVLSILLLQIFKVMDNLRQIASASQIQLITSILIHTYHGKQMIFLNTVIYQTSNLVSNKFSIKFIEHAYPHTALNQELPYSIINQKYVKDKESTVRLLLLLSQLVKQEREDQRQGAIVSEKTNNYLSSIFSQCNELSELSLFVKSEETYNPYWLFINPIFKFRQEKKIEDRKRRLQSSTQYFKDDEEFNEDHIICKLHVLEQYIKEVLVSANPIQREFIQICVIAMVKHIHQNSQALWQVTSKNALFAHYFEKKIQLLINLKQFKEKINNEMVGNGTYVHFKLPAPHEQKHHAEQYETLRDKTYKALALPVCLTTLFLLAREYMG